MSNSDTDNVSQEQRLQNIKDRQGLLRARSKTHSWRNILDKADLNYKSTMVQFHTGFISGKKMARIEKELDARETIENINID